MTEEEKDIQKAEQKAMAEVRRWKRKLAKRLEGLTFDERLEYWQKSAERLRAEGFNIVSSIK